MANTYKHMGEAFHHLRKILTENGWQEGQGEFDLFFDKETDAGRFTIMVSHVVPDNGVNEYGDEKLAEYCGEPLADWHKKQLLIQYKPDTDMSLLVADINAQTPDFINVVLAKEESRHGVPVFAGTK